MVKNLVKDILWLKIFSKVFCGQKSCQMYFVVKNLVKDILWLKILSKIFCAKLHLLENTIVVVFSFTVVVFVKILLPFVMFL